jgi:hypothetical protein
LKKTNLQFRIHNSVSAAKKMRRKILFKAHKRIRNFYKNEGLASPPPFADDAELKFKDMRAKDIWVPETLSLSEGFANYANFIREFKYYAFEKQRRVRPLFQGIRWVSAGAALMLVAEIDRWRRLYGFKPRAVGFKDWEPEVARLLWEMGFFDLLEVANVPRREGHDDNSMRKFIRFQSENRAAGEASEALRNALGEVGKLQILGDQFYDAIVEAMTNVTKHAYPDDDNRGALRKENRWWMAGSIDKHVRRLKVSFYDLGVGIPGTLEKRHGSGAVNKLMSKFGLAPSDSALIRAAMEIGRSGTGKAHRGKGLAEIREFVEVLGPGTLRIISGQGELIYSCDENGNCGEYKLSDHSISVEGTYIEWEVAIPDTNVIGEE